MAHKSLISGTAYNISGGKSLISGTAYNISSGKSLISGTAYNINFKKEPFAMLYSDGNFIFQLGNKVENGKTLSNMYNGFIDKSYSP